MNERDVEQQLRRFLAPVPPPPGGLAAGRERMLAAAAQLQPADVGLRRSAKTQLKGGPRLAWAYRALLWAAIAALALGAAGAGAAYASAGSLPGGSLYPVKLGLEELRMATTADAAARAELSFQFLGRRLREVERLAEQGEEVAQEPVQRLIRHMEQVMVEIARARPEQTPMLLARYAERLELQQRTLRQVGTGESQPALALALQATVQMQEQVRECLADPLRLQQRYGLGRPETAGPGTGGGQPTATPLPSPSPTSGPAGDRDQEPAPPGEQQRQQSQDRVWQQTAEPSGTCDDCDPDRDRMRQQLQSCTPTPGGTGGASATPPGAQGQQGQNQQSGPPPTLTPAPTGEPSATPPGNQAPGPSATPPGNQGAASPATPAGSQGPAATPPGNQGPPATPPGNQGPGSPATPAGGEPPGSPGPHGG